MLKKGLVPASKHLGTRCYYCSSTSLPVDTQNQGVRMINPGVPVEMEWPSSLPHKQINRSFLLDSSLPYKLPPSIAGSDTMSRISLNDFILTLTGLGIRKQNKWNYRERYSVKVKGDSFIQSLVHL